MPVFALWNQITHVFGGFVKQPSFHTSIFFDPAARSISIVTDGPCSDTFVIKLHDSSMNFLGQINAQEGINFLPDLPEGKYFYKLLTLKGQLVKKGRFNVAAL